MQLYVAQEDGQQQGPFDLKLVRSRLADGTFQGSDFAWHEGLADWLPLASIPALAGGIFPPLPAGGNRPQGTISAYAGPAPRTSGLAIASMILGILSLLSVGLTALPAVICGHRALARIRRAFGTISGQGMAVTGLVTGYVGLAFFSLFCGGLAAGISLPVFNPVQEMGLETTSISQAKQVGLACKAYAGDHEGKFPATLDDLMPGYLTDKNLFVCPLGRGGPESGYNYSGGKSSDSDHQVLLTSQATSHDHKRVTVYVDGSAAMVRD